MQKTTPPRRRWLQFSLRTMFVVVTTVACWLGWELKVVRDRKALRSWIDEHGGFVEGWTPPVATNMPKAWRDKAEAISYLRLRLGDEPLYYINLNFRDVRLEDVERAERLFPEAFVVPDKRYFDRATRRKSDDSRSQ